MIAAGPETEFGTNTPERRAEMRLTTALPVLEVDGEKRRLVDFSNQGFRAGLPLSYQRVGATGRGIIHISAAGHTVQKHITFRVLNHEENTVGAQYTTVETVTEAADTLF